MSVMRGSSFRMILRACVCQSISQSLNQSKFGSSFSSQDYDTGPGGGGGVQNPLPRFIRSRGNLLPEQQQEQHV